MPYADEYDYDVFISYAQKDNRPLDGRRVTAIVERLEGHLIARLGWQNPPRIFFDQFEGGEAPTRLEGILNAVKRSATFLAIGSPNYVRPWTLAEMDVFASLPNAVERMFCAELLPRPPESGVYPPPLNELRQVWFWALDPEKRFALELHRGSKGYRQAVVTLGERVRQKLHHLAPELSRPPTAGGDNLLSPGTATARTPARPSPEPPSAVERCIVLGLCGADMQDRADELAASLAFGSDPVTVLPSQPYADDPAALRAAFEADLQRAPVFVQLLGADAPASPPGFRDGVAQYQLDVARARNKTILQWRAHDLDPAAIADPAHRRLVEAASCPIRGFEDFKAEVKKLAGHAGPAVAADPPATVFIYAPREQLGQAEEIGRLFEEAKFTVALPKGETRGEIRTHRDRMFGAAEVLMFVPDPDPEAVWVDDNLILFDAARAQMPAPKALGVCSPPDTAGPIEQSLVTTLRPRDRNQSGPLRDFIQGLRR